ncbi:MAG: T9SS type A sorting domain-containing protein [Saprospiraceae bacterium]|nr:T9SS type A sorting domain-containing protein [Saprospiraceae bacterium]MCB9322846.1 T9SS type A sorting domain-containing protein [Lewinellaceae bacterium]
MKYFLPFVFMLFMSTLTLSQDISILLVDDSKDDFFNTDLLKTALENGSYAFDLYNVPDSLAVPEFAYLQNYDLVIWHTSTDGVGLGFWNFNDEINGGLAQYLSEGGNLWLTGNDFLYDVYNTPSTFVEGDFAYDFLGIESYDAQTYADDGGFGVAFVTPAMDQPITGLGDIDWQFSTLWYADSFTGREGAVSIYEMGGDGYALQGSTAGLWYDNGTSKCLSFAFDLALASSQGVIDNTVSSVVDFFASVITTNNNIIEVIPAFEIFPNPINESAKVSFELKETASVQIDIFNMNGQKVFGLLPLSNLTSGIHSFDWIPAAALNSGMYEMRIKLGQQVFSKPVQIIR